MALSSSFNSLLALNDKADDGGDAPDIIPGTVCSFMLKRLQELLHLLGSFADFLREKSGQIFPQETRSTMLHHRLVNGLTILLPVALSLLCLYHCCKRCRGRGSAVRMMKAPGKRGRVMSRATFEGNPGGYFRDLRAKRA